MVTDDVLATRRECEAILNRGDSYKASRLARELLEAMDKLARLHPARHTHGCVTCEQLRRFNGLETAAK